LKSISTDNLQRDIAISIRGELLKEIPTGQGTLIAAQLKGKNALAMVLFHSALDQTQQDENATLAMMQVLFDKKLDPNTQARVAYWIQSQDQDIPHEYISLFPFQEIAGFKAAAYKIREYQGSLSKEGA
jgi:hypothetical protein